MYVYVAVVVVAMDLWWWLKVLVLVQENISHIPAKKPRPLAKKVVYMSVYAFMMGYLCTGPTYVAHQLESV